MEDVHGMGRSARPSLQDGCKTHRSCGGGGTRRRGGVAFATMVEHDRSNSADASMRMHDRLCARGEEVAQVQPLVAYYCWMRAAEHALSASQVDRRHEADVTKLLLRLEEQNVDELGGDVDESGKRDRTKDRARVEGLAMQIFATADGQLRRWEQQNVDGGGDGRVEAELAKKMYAAATFLDASRACPDGDGTSGMGEAKKKEIETYANYKAAQLVQAAKRKRENPSLSNKTAPETKVEEPTTQEEEEELERAFAKLDQQEKDEQVEPTEPKETEEKKAGATLNATKHVEDHYETHLPPKQVVEATKLARNAVSALQFNDIATAKDNLEKALHLLR